DEPDDLAGARQSADHGDCGASLPLLGRLVVRLALSQAREVGAHPTGLSISGVPAGRGTRWGALSACPLGAAALLVLHRRPEKHLSGDGQARLVHPELRAVVR